MGSTFLQVFLFINVFLAGALTVFALRHAYAHFKPSHHEAEKPHPAVQGLQLPPAVKEQILAAAATKFQTILDHSADELQHDMQATAGQLNKQLDKLGTEIVTHEMNRYRESLDALRKQTEATLTNAHSEVTAHQEDLKTKLSERHAELEAKMLEEVETEKQHMVQQIDTKLADAVASFLIETMQHDVDLGAQTPYLTKMLEEHKADFKQGVADETATAK